MPEINKDVIISSRVRLARNLSDIPFPSMMNDVLAADVVARVADAIAKAPDARSYMLRRMQDTPHVDRMRLVEKHLISVELANKNDGAALINQNEHLSLMINEEDHLRIQALLPGLQLEEAARLAFEVDDVIEAAQPYAFDPDWGYLTACPTNTGTGMRASVMMHLPALKLRGQINHIFHAIGSIGLTVRGLYGEGSESAGNLYQLSNQVTLGRTEEDIVKSLHATCMQLCEHERNARRRLLEAGRVEFEDRVFRAWGLFTNARKMDTKEFMQHYSDVRMGIDAGLITDTTLGELDDLMVALQPASIICANGADMSTEERDQMRATRIRESLAGVG